MSDIFRGQGVIEVAKDAGTDYRGGEEVGWDPAAGTSGQVVVGSGGRLGIVHEPTQTGDTTVLVLLPQGGRHIQHKPAAAVANNALIQLASLDWAVALTDIAAEEVGAVAV